MKQIFPRLSLSHSLLTHEMNMRAAADSRIVGIYIHVYICICICVYLFIYVCIYVQMCVYKYINIGYIVYIVYIYMNRAGGREIDR
jgi:hypothetical protein